MAIDFVNSGSDIVNFKLNANRYEASSVKENLFEEFQVNETWKWITDNSFKRVGRLEFLYVIDSLERTKVVNFRWSRCNVLHSCHNEADPDFKVI